jgi:transcriptional regulator with XRE-family HTH domain
VTFQARFAENLARCRKSAGLTQEEVAGRAALARDTVWKYERQIHVPILDALIRLGGALSVPPAELLDGIAYKPSFIGLGEGGYEIATTPPSEARTSGE